MTKRFVETVSTGDIKDNCTGKKYRCKYRIDDEFLKLINQIAEENKQLKRGILKIIDDKIKEREIDLERSVRAGMPTGLIYSEIELLNELKESL